MKANPLLKHIFDLIGKNNLSLSDLGMTQKVKDETDIQMGKLQQEGTEKQSLLAFQEKQAEQLGRLGDMLKASKENLKKDPILIEHNQNSGDG